MAQSIIFTATDTVPTSEPLTGIDLAGLLIVPAAELRSEGEVTIPRTFRPTAVM